MKRFLVLAAALVTAACVGIGVAASASSPRSGELHVTKECSQYQGQAGQFCTITSSNIPWIRAGMQVVYADAANFASTPPMLDTDVILSAGHGSAASGHVTLNLATAQGTVTFAGGTGAFKTFQGSANVTVDAKGVWHWEGRDVQLQSPVQLRSFQSHQRCRRTATRAPTSTTARPSTNKPGLCQ